MTVGACLSLHTWTFFCRTNLFELLLSLPIPVEEMDPFYLFLSPKCSGHDFSVFAVVAICQEITNSGGPIVTDGLLLRSQNPVGHGPSLCIITECHEVATNISLRLQAVIVTVWIPIKMADTDKGVSILLVPRFAELWALESWLTSVDLILTLVCQEQERALRDADRHPFLDGPVERL